MLYPYKIFIRIEKKISIFKPAMSIKMGFGFENWRDEVG